jgi:hypothetical protein
MSEMSDYLEVKLLNLTLNASAYTAPTAHVALHTADPTDAGTGAEVSGGSYARQTVSFATAAGTSGSVTTDADMTFPTATGSWGTVTHVGIWDAVSSGNLLYHTPLDSSKVIGEDDIFKITAGNLTVTLA